MIRHFILLSFRHFLRHKTSFLINVVGLGTGLTCVMLIFLWVQDEYQFDAFHKNSDRLYQVLKHAESPGGEINTFEWTPGPLAQGLPADFPEVEFAVGVVEKSSVEQGIISVNKTMGEKRFKASGWYVGEDFFNVFSYQLLIGDPLSALKNKSGVLISHTLAKKLFSDETKVMGASLNWDAGPMSGPYQITGVFEAPPYHATAQFDLLFNYEHYLDRFPQVNQWTYGGPSTYIVLNEGANPKDFNRKIGTYLQEKSQEDYQHIFIQKYADRYLHGNFENGIQVGGRIGYVRLFSLIALFVLLIACINYVNLTTARASLRIKEVAIKKTVGANRKTLIFQYLCESMLISLMGIFLAFTFVELLLPYFNVLTGKKIALQLDITLLLSIVGFGAILGCIAGSYPAFYLSSFKPAITLKGKIHHSVGELWIRRGLVVFQFSVSMILMIAVWITYEQIQFIQHKPLGFSKENVIYIERNGNLQGQLSPFMSEVNALPGVLQVSSMRSNLLENGTLTRGVMWEGADPENRPDFKYLCVGHDFIETMGIPMVEGRSFSREFRSDSSSIIFNEEAIKQMGIENPIGKKVVQWGMEKTIIGVVKDFHFESLYEEIKPCFLFFDRKVTANNIFIKLAHGAEKQTIDQISKIYDELNRGVPLEFQFLDQDYQVYYESEKRIATLSQYFAAFALSISCLGLFGLVAFMANRRRKEIGIRKVLGASTAHLVGLLSKDFLWLVTIAIFIAAPLGWLIVEQWLSQFAFRINIQWWIFLMIGGLAILIAFLTVSYQSVKAALVNPVESLRNE